LSSREWGIAVQSGTDAMNMALDLAEIPEGSRVMIPAYICTAVLDALYENNLKPELIDISPKTYSISVEDVNKSNSTFLIAAHLFGIKAELEGLAENKILIEDCAQTPPWNKKYQIGEKGLFSVFSLYSTKVLASGHGGIIVGDGEEYFRKAMDKLRHDNRSEWKVHKHFLMSDLNASLALSQLEKLDYFIEKRRNIAERFMRALDCNEKMPEKSCFSRFAVRAENGAQKFIESALKNGIEVKRPVYKPLYEYLHLPSENFPNTKKVYESLVSIPVYPALKEKEIKKIEAFLERKKNEISCRPSA
jgi:dTDP-4-amino-4,6-dideoxygalactose transaminase